jgi:hypothetical protein
MVKPASWRLSSDYIGAGRFILQKDRAIVGTSYGAQCLPHGSSTYEGWTVDLGSRCIGIVPGADDSLIVTCVKGLFVLAADGSQRWGTHSEKEIVYPAVPFGVGVLLASRSAIHFVVEGKGSQWRFGFDQVLGASVRSARLVNLFELDGHVVAGVVDYDSGIGRVAVLSKDGELEWTSEPGPLSELFPAGNAVFVWCLTGYGRFESHMTRLDGHEIWAQDFAGVGTVRGDGSLAMLVGSNESPEWDNWAYRQVAPNGNVERQLPTTGRCTVRPLCLADGTVFFVGSVLHLDPASSRVDYTSFQRMPQELLFQHLLGIKPQLPEYEISVQIVREGSVETETLYHARDSFSLAQPQGFDGDVVFGDGADIVGMTA